MPVAGAATKLHRAPPEQPVLIRKVSHECDTQESHFTGCCELLPVGQAGCVPEDGSAHSEIMRARRHYPCKSLLRPRELLANNDCRVIAGNHNHSRNGFPDSDFFTGADTQFCRNLIGRMAGDRKLLFPLQAAGLKGFEGQVERHHFRQGCGMIERVRAALSQDLPGSRVHHEICVSGLNPVHCGEYD